MLEKHICEHLSNFLKENDLFHPFQSGFRKSHSTETALIRLVDQLLFNLDNDKVTGLVFIDYKKAFDLIDHKLLLSKLRALVVGESRLPVFRDYLFYFYFILFHFHCIRQGYCSGEGLERNIRTIQASPPRNYNRHLNKQTKQNYNLMKLQLLICPRLI